MDYSGSLKCNLIQNSINIWNINTTVIVAVLRYFGFKSVTCVYVLMLELQQLRRLQREKVWLVQRLESSLMMDETFL